MIAASKILLIIPFLFMVILFNGSWCLRDVRLKVIPPAVQRGQSAILLCLYELEGAPLYAVKWYRGTHEFYRYSPSEIPANKVFKYRGIHVDVDLSNSTQVVLREVGLNLAGNFSCEVTTDAPSFSTSVVSEQMTVIELPESGPVVAAERDRYALGDVLRANCSAPPSRPPAELSFQVNGIAVGVTSWAHRDATTSGVPGNGDVYSNGNAGGIQQRARSDAWLNLQLLPAHFSTPAVGSTSNGGAMLRVTCTSRVKDGGYHESTTIQLAARLGEPVHQRVMSPNVSSKAKLSTILYVLLYLICKANL